MTTEQEMIRRAIALGRATLVQIRLAELTVLDFEAVSTLFGLSFAWGSPPSGDGMYSKELRQILLREIPNSRERVNFTFGHELMHALIEDDEDFLSAYADVEPPPSDEFMERLCNAGAAELLIPSDEVKTIIRTQGFGVELVRLISSQYSVSAIAAAIQLVNCAAHSCYLVVAELRQIPAIVDLPMLGSADPLPIARRLVVVNAGKSPAAKYGVRRGVSLSREHGLYESLDHPDTPIRIRAYTPYSQYKWEMDCEVLCHGGRVYAYYNETPAIPVEQLSLFE